MGPRWAADAARGIAGACRRRFLRHAGYPAEPGTAHAGGREALPLRAELFSSDQMAQHGVRLAGTHRLATGRQPDQLLARLAANEALLRRTCRQLIAAVTAKHRITPAGEWLLDNFHLVEEQIRTARRHLPRGYSRQLPGLATGASGGLPRVYALALETIAHGDGRVDPDSLSRFVAAYQTISPLRLGELWAIPIMLRLALIENLRRVAVRIASGRAQRDLAVAWAAQLIEVARLDPKNLVLVIADMARSGPPMTPPFVSELARRLQGQGHSLALPLTWIEQQLAGAGSSIEQSVRSGNQHQAADQVSISNSIGSLRFLGTMDWREFVESMSLVEQTLRGDPAGQYADMEFATRDRYRHVIEAVARLGAVSEDAVAVAALGLAQVAATAHGTGVRSAHVGYYLIDRGRPALEQAVVAHLPAGALLRRRAAHAALALYLGAIALLTGLLGTGLLGLWAGAGLPAWAWAPLALLVAVASSQIACTVVNRLTTLLAAPHVLPRMDYARGVPLQARTLVVIPTLITGARNIDRLAEALEVRFLANRDPNVFFALLTDLRDADQQTLPEDAGLLALARARIEDLNARYGHAGHDAFLLLHRPRRWNPHDGIWMGYERKRGKLEDLNRLLLEGNREGFSLLAGNLDALGAVRYVITLDTDTQLPRDAARQCIGTMAHPLNRPQYDAAAGRVVAGYGILQPRVSVSLPGASLSRYARMHGGEPGIDPYTRAVSDVYQDAFSEGSFIGKGIYDVAAFDQALRGRFRENRILSHDLLEGCHARAGLLSDVQLYEEYPARYGADVDRRTRWVRGDWQLAGWLLPWLRGPDRRWMRNPLPVLARWKLLDNLRRSLVPAALGALLVLGWTGLAASGAWTLLLLAVLLSAPLLEGLGELLHRPAELRLRPHLAACARASGQRALQAAFALAVLPHEAAYCLGAILRTGWRLLVSHRRLLEWNPSADQERGARRDFRSTCRDMAVGPALAIGVAVVLASIGPGALLPAGPVLLLWLGSPLFAWWLSQPPALREAPLGEARVRLLGRLARRTWAFFEAFVGPVDHWLPPDNYQEYGIDTVAHRTSPTNMGLALLANLGAHDFGYITTGDLIERTGNALHTMAGLERHRGHFYNWYDTRTLVPLNPAYVSTVDSGNLAGHLLTLRPGLGALCDAPLLPPRWLDGLRDTLGVLEEAAGAPLPEAVVALRDVLAAPGTPAPSTLVHSWHLLGRLGPAIAAVRAASGAGAGAEAQWWGEVLERQCAAVLEELLFLAPWLEMPAAPHAPAGHDTGPAPASLRALGEAQATPRDAPGSDAVTGAWTARRATLIDLGRRRARARIAALERLAAQAGELAVMEFGFLYDQAARLLAIGYNVADRRRDASCYDLLASEARLAVFVAIAQGEIPQESWFALGRLLTSTGTDPVLLSWSGSMFEYLMPQLVMPGYAQTLIDQTVRAAVAHQIAYGQACALPWGMSESGYNAVDVQLNYQYRAFGVPGLGLKRGLDEDLVVAPYASIMALMVAPEAACANLERLAAAGAAGRFGFYEAIDYTPARQRRGETHAVVRSYMAHHQGMGLLALVSQLLGKPMQRRFASDARFQATLLLLQERIPRAATFREDGLELGAGRGSAASPEMPVRVLTDPDAPAPQVQLLSNGRYHVMISHAGGGHSRWRELAVTRWHEDPTRDAQGSFAYVRVLPHAAGGGGTWSTTHQPSLRHAAHYEAIFSEGRAEFRRRDRAPDFDFDTHTDIVVSPEDDIELRRVRITNRSAGARTVELTTYAEVVLAPAAADALHPAFSNLFVQTEIVAAQQAILCTRRPRSRDEPTPWLFHLLAVHDAEVAEISYETDRARFLGRGRDAAAPCAMDPRGQLHGSHGSVLDPLMAVRCRITLAPEQSACIDLVYGIAPTRPDALLLVEKYRDRRLADRVFELAWTHAQVVLRQIDASEADAQLYGRMAGAVIYAQAALRAEASLMVRNHRGQSGLWGYAISGDLPIVLLRMSDLAHVELVRQLIQAHGYWRLKGLAVDLVIWNEDRGGYRQVLQDGILGLVAVGLDAQAIDRPGGIFIRAAEQISEEDRILFQTVARIILSDTHGTLAEQLARVGPLLPALPAALTVQPGAAAAAAAPPLPGRELILGNGLGGFTPDGREYVITTTAAQCTPAPWVNVLANAGFGSVISESGQAYTWAENAHEMRLTPWHNDPVTDASGEAFYLRDELSGQFWSPAPLPRRGATPYLSRHGFGYSVFEHEECGIRSELWVYVAIDRPVKFSVLKVHNRSGRPRRLSATGYVEWVLGDLRQKSAMYVVTGIDPDTGALTARNPYNSEFPHRVAFFAVDEARHGSTCDRTEFIGRNGSLANPAALGRTHLSGRCGIGFDPCAALQVPLDLADGEQREIVFRLGLGSSPGGADVAALERGSHGAATARQALDSVWQYWNHTLGAVQVDTPDPALNVLANGWLVYQTLASRIWARSGAYQSGGAFGFRDQLQDAMALLHCEPALLRAHLLLCAGRQFVEGDVQHWWHPPSGRGVRTHCSDDYLWLALATCRYVGGTGDTGVLHESAPFLEGRAVAPDDDSWFDLPTRSASAASLYEHCVRAIRHGLRFGAHGLPLMGSGDWNDGMNRVGISGRGESVWLGFFLHAVLAEFRVLAGHMGDTGFAEQCGAEAATLAANLERHAWDGAWYRRAWFDDGTALGSADNRECRIDAIAQSWAVLSGVASPARARQALQSLDEHLVRREAGLVALLDPPFDTTELDPGYIKGYVPGVRENGGQYTHAAIWAAMAFAAQGDSRRAWELATLINPANHGDSADAIAVYKVEPYVMAADVYAVAPHTGRGGWTWYTGSAGWMYRLLLESLLGLRLEGQRLHLAPGLPAHWNGFTVHYRYRETVYHVSVARADPGDGGGLSVDGTVQPGRVIPLCDDRREHAVQLRIPAD